MFGTVLVANRGEIALRVARTCRELGIRVAAVHSTVDRESAVVRYADETVQIGPGPARRSYLDYAAVLAAAERVGADAIHPGYGFLSEDPSFAEACEAAGFTFIGPPPKVIAALGDKTAARALMAAAGLPLLPGEPVADVARAAAVAGGVGYPVIIKAAAGGGGRGMRVVERAADLADAYLRTRAEAQALFGDDRVYVERYLPNGRHVEIQVLADAHGNAVHLGERDCSVQRRHQKLIEETPAPGVPRDVVARMGEASVRGALAAGYVGAGTFEYLLDDAGDFFFLEVNCRIQVEHPVTEAVTGLDLVAEQLRIAAGEPLGLTQADVAPRGVAIECRVNAEDPARDFAPAPGRLDAFTVPGGPFVRVDTHAYPGYSVPSAYDSLLAKLIVWAPDRDTAIARSRRALADFRVDGPGVHTTAGFLRDVLADASFRAGTHDTGLVARLQSQPETQEDS
ncbi:acetyl-CoA carboxylase biotin carboxylase subunit [Dactylosporangium sp. NPDC049742]|uniref:acetyl-CoA carboxylase biotin carboxylase subunit n=1 Tax=Dactylosporangium sp. NPDC049742 TaxID=3154737 RepID=UPI003436680E